jgi:PRC-barrel domain protein
MFTVEDIKDWRGQDVVDPGGDKLGKLEEIYYDMDSDVPAFAAVKTGRIGKHLSLVPLSGASVGQAYLRVARAKAEFKDAPNFDPDTELTLDDEAAAFRHYGIDYAPAPSGARRLAKH